MTHWTVQAGFPAYPIVGGLQIKLEARSPDTDVEVADVNATRFTIYGYDESDEPQADLPTPILILPESGSGSA